MVDKYMLSKGYLLRKINLQWCKYPKSFRIRTVKQFIQCSISEVDDHLKDADLLVLSTKPSITYDVPTVTAISLITGIGANETCNQILEYLKD